MPDKSPAPPVRRSAETIAFLALRPLGLHQLNYHMELLWNRNFRLKPAFAKHEPPEGEQHDVLPKDGQTEEKKMRSTRTTLLVGIAALALVAGNGLASAQEKSETSKGAPHATQQMNHSGTSGQSSPGAQTQQPGAMSKQGQRTEGAQNRAQKEEQNRSSAQSNEKKGTTATENERSKRSNTAQERERKGGQNAAERNRNGNTAAEQQNRTGGWNTNAERGRTGMEGLQGNASGMNVRLTDQQRTEIRSSVINGHGAPRVAHVDFDVTVGTVVPRGRIHVVPVPETLVRIEPAWRGFLYFVYEDEVVIVDPNDMKIVAVVAA